ncbi:hypothetical protein [Pseudarthrobacter sp. NPDC058119]|uniref:hypothetical protein n=1 Tax=Pseudarthrobacter sp. NPDC058119 TaxID=3346348 RepID=UPI0036DAAB3C
MAKDLQSALGTSVVDGHPGWGGSKQQRRCQSVSAFKSLAGVKVHSGRQLPQKVCRQGCVIHCGHGLCRYVTNVLFRQDHEPPHPRCVGAETFSKQEGTYIGFTDAPRFMDTKIYRGIGRFLESQD